MVSDISLSTLQGTTSVGMRVNIPGDTQNLALNLFFTYNTMAGYWVIDLYDASTGIPIIMSIPMLYGYDLLGQFKYLNIGSLYVVNIGDITILDPDNLNAYSNFKLTWIMN